MSLEEKLSTDLKNAMRQKDEASKRGIRAIKAAILNQKTDGSGKVLDEAGEVALLQKLVKQRRDSLDIYEKSGREDLAVVEREELDVINRYLPEMIEGAELEAIVAEIIEKVGATSMRDMGKVMGAANGALKGKAEGRNISTAVKKILSGK